MNRPPQLQATIPFPCKTLQEVRDMKARFTSIDLLKETRGDWVQIVEAEPWDFSDNRWYAVIHTGNLLGMIYDLRSFGLM